MTDIIPFTPSEKLIEEFPEISQITIYGTTEDPLFPLGQVEDAIGSKRIRVDMGGYRLGIDYVKLVCNRSDGRPREQNLLTEQGLYKVLARTDTPVSEKFQTFTKVVMKELRLRGAVTLNDAIRKLNEQLEDEHVKLLQYKRDSERFYMQKMDAQTKLLAAQVKIERVDNYDAGYQLERIKNKCLKKVYVYQVKPPKAVEEDFPEYDRDSEPNTDDEICFEVSFRTRLESPCGEFHVYKDISMEKLYAKLHQRDYSVMIGDKEHRSIFQGSLDRLQYTIDEFITE